MKWVSIALAYPAMIAMLIVIALLANELGKPLGMVFAELDSIARDREIDINNGTAK